MIDIYKPGSDNNPAGKYEEVGSNGYKVENARIVSINQGDRLFSWAINLPEENSIRIAGDKGGLSLPDLELYTDLGQHQVNIKPKILSRSYDSYDFNGHYYLMEHVVNVLDKKEELIIKPKETLNVIACIEAFYLSAKLNREVRFEEMKNINK